MNDDFLARREAADFGVPPLELPAARRRGPRLWTMLSTALLAFLLGGALIAWLVWRGTLTPAMLGGNPFAAAPPPAAVAASSPALAQTELALAGRLAALEMRQDKLDLQAQAAAGNAARAEALLIAFAARRAADRGAPLGYLEDQLKLRFGDALPNAVQQIIADARDPITLDQLALGLDRLAPRLASGAPAAQSGWERFTGELQDLLTIRRDPAPVVDPGTRFDRARIALREGRIGDAINTVQSLPGAAQGQPWIAAARRYTEMQRALDLLETTALLEPRELRDAGGRKVAQQSPAATPVTLPPAQN
jgi:hypothetical protein